MIPHRAWLAAAWLLALVPACSSSKSDPPAPDCATDRKIGSACAGLRTGAVCDAEVCTTGVTCSTVIRVSNDAELTAATGSAAAGSCIALTAGTYTEARLPGGVSLLGKGAASVSIGKIVVNGGSDATIRGITVLAGGIELPAPQRVHIDMVKLQAASQDAIVATGSASFTITASEIEGAARNGVLATDAQSVTIEGTFIHGSKGPGVWAECTTGCGCTSVDIRDTILRDNRIVGVSLVSATGTLKGVDVTNNGVASNFSPGAGIAAAKCSTLNAQNTRVLDNTGYGVLLDASSGNLSDLEVSRNLMGLWVQNVDASAAPVTIERAKLVENQGVGLGLSNAGSTVTVRASEIAQTKNTVLPTFSKGAISTKEVGDGIAWTGKSLARIENVTLRANARASVLIDGSVAAGSRIESATLQDGDEIKGIVQQNFPNGGVAPDLGPALPAPQRVADELFSVPQSPKAPARAQ